MNKTNTIRAILNQSPVFSRSMTAFVWTIKLNKRIPGRGTFPFQRTEAAMVKLFA